MPDRALSAEEFERRRPVWMAVSEFWLDTELDDADFERIAGVMRASGYSLEELYAIYADELAPHLWPSLLSVAGPWAGFDEEWLCGCAARSATLRGRSWGRWYRLMGSRRCWQRVEAILLR